MDKNKDIQNTFDEVMENYIKEKEKEEVEKELKKETIKNRLNIKIVDPDLRDRKIDPDFPIIRNPDDMTDSLKRAELKPNNNVVRLIQNILIKDFMASYHTIVSDESVDIFIDFSVYQKLPLPFVLTITHDIKNNLIQFLVRLKDEEKYEDNIIEVVNKFNSECLLLKACINQDNIDQDKKIYFTYYMVNEVVVEEKNLYTILLTILTEMNMFFERNEKEEEE